MRNGPFCVNPVTFGTFVIRLVGGVSCGLPSRRRQNRTLPEICNRLDCLKVQNRLFLAKMVNFWPKMAKFSQNSAFFHQNSIFFQKKFRAIFRVIIYRKWTLRQSHWSQISRRVRIWRPSDGKPHETPPTSRITKVPKVTGLTQKWPFRIDHSLFLSKSL